jgi:hypothetical protein
MHLSEKKTLYAHIHGGFWFSNQINKISFDYVKIIMRNSRIECVAGGGCG